MIKFTFMLVIVLIFFSGISLVYRRIKWNRILQDYNGLQKIYKDLKQENIRIRKMSYIPKKGKQKETLEFVYVRLDEEELFVIESIFHFSFEVKIILGAGSTCMNRLVNNRYYGTHYEFDFSTNTLYLNY